MDCLRAIFGSAVTTDKNTLFEFTNERDIDGKPFDFATLAGKVSLVANVASKCGKTRCHYAEFGELTEKFTELVIVAFPCNQFLYQEPGESEEIKGFTERRGFKGVLMDKVKVNGADATPVFDFLKAKSHSGAIMWNFTKFLVDADGHVVARYGPGTTPNELIPKIEELTAAAGRRK